MSHPFLYLQKQVLKALRDEVLMGRVEPYESIAVMKLLGAASDYQELLILLTALKDEYPAFQYVLQHQRKKLTEEQDKKMMELLQRLVKTHPKEATLLMQKVIRKEMNAEQLEQEYLHYHTA